MNPILKEICADICSELQLYRERVSSARAFKAMPIYLISHRFQFLSQNKLKRNMDHEIIQTQAAMITRLSKRLRLVEEDAVNENKNSQSTQSSQESKSSQSAYVPESDSSEDHDVLEPMVRKSNETRL